MATEQNSKTIFVYLGLACAELFIVLSHSVQIPIAFVRSENKLQHGHFLMPFIHFRVFLRASSLSINFLNGRNVKQS